MIKKVKSYVIACQKHQKLQRSAAPTKPNEHGGLKQGKELKECDKNKLASRRKKKKKSDSRQRHIVDVHQTACNFTKLLFTIGF